MTKKKLPSLPSDTTNLGQPTGGVEKIDPIVFPNLSTLYERRLGRISFLKERMGEEENPYLDFIQKIVERQKQLLGTQMLPHKLLEEINSLEKSKRNLSVEELKKLPRLFEAFKAFIDPLVAELPATSSQHFEKLDESLFLRQSSLLLEGNFSGADNSLATLLWAFLSLCFAVARDLSTEEEFIPQNKEEAFSDNCPCCGSLSSGSIIMTGKREGLRYRQCALCEARWHKVRAVCTVCNKSENMDYWMINDKQSPIEIESCGDCKTYSKIFRLDRDVDLEVVADDLSSLPLDTMIEEKGFSRNSINPFSLPL